MVKNVVSLKNDKTREKKNTGTADCVKSITFSLI